MFVSRDDVLTSRGANPRTGLITPYTSEETGKGTEEISYVHIRNLQKQPMSNTGIQEKWRQDELGWCLVEGRNDPKVPNQSGASSVLQAKIKGQVYTMGRSGEDRSVADRRKMHSTEKGTESETRLSHDRVKEIADGSPGSPFHIPRKEVGSTTRSSSVPILGFSPDQGQQASSIEFVSGAHTVSRSFLPSHAEVEDRALGYYARPSSPSKAQRPRHDASVFPLKVQQHSGIDVYKARHKDQAPSQRDRNDLHYKLSSKPSPHPFGATHRRPPELLPNHLQGGHATLKLHHPKGAQNRLQVPNNAPIHRTAGKRPPIRRATGLASVPLAKPLDHLKTLDLHVDETTAVPFPGKTASRPLEHMLYSKFEPPLPLRRANVVHKPFPSLRSSSTTTAFANDSSPQARFGKCLPLLAVNGVPLDEQCGVEDFSNLPATAPASTMTTLADPIQEHVSPQKQSHGSMVRRRSLRKAKDVWDSCLEVAREISLLVDDYRIYESILDIIKHAALAFQRLPRALHTLQSQDAELWDLLSATRHMMSAVGFLVLVLSMLAALTKVLKLVADIGACFWYPISLLLMVIRWMLLH
ncbi:MAG: hypothetical protein Q9174_000580 [Haloplaca sp. 1 TL-2023]